MNLVGGVDSQGGYVSKMLYVKMKESGPLRGRAPGTPCPRSANVLGNSNSVDKDLEVDKKCILDS